MDQHEDQMARDAYAVYEKHHDDNRCGVDSFDDVDDLERGAWLAVAEHYEEKATAPIDESKRYFGVRDLHHDQSPVCTEIPLETFKAMLEHKGYRGAAAIDTGVREVECDDSEFNDRFAAEVEAVMESEVEIDPGITFGQIFWYVTF